MRVIYSLCRLLILLPLSVQAQQDNTDRSTPGFAALKITPSAFVDRFGAMTLFGTEYCYKDQYYTSDELNYLDPYQLPGRGYRSM